MLLGGRLRDVQLVRCSRPGPLRARQNTVSGRRVLLAAAGAERFLRGWFGTSRTTGLGQSWLPASGAHGWHRLACRRQARSADRTKMSANATPLASVAEPWYWRASPAGTRLLSAR